jgi:hypothetical protein
MPRKLKVYRTSAGFSDAYVAAPSQKAALAAWGSDANLFARGLAEEVTDPALMAQPLAKPGEVLTVSRGDLADHLKALKGTARKKEAAHAPAEMRPAAKKKRALRKRPAPTREKIDAAEKALKQAQADHAKEIAALEKQRDAAEQAVKNSRAKAVKKLGALQRKLDTEREAYSADLEAWSEE